MGPTCAKMAPKRASRILACQADSGSEAETNENELMKLELTAKMIRNMEVHWSTWRRG